MLPLKQYHHGILASLQVFAQFFDRVVSRVIIGDVDANIGALFELLNGAYQCRGNVPLRYNKVSRLLVSAFFARTETLPVPNE